ncbi:Ankyrin repeat-containing domain [Pseudocohnilembus persalinus]|uniref:Ankyrin repeat-containing domain n=1 Tax=Pseudocohnilembus persalinus TaxID=266149 RepID=A0A0V0QJ60_PSEPJ|nr:Ankyrin repeat-containing domain [Pseudocohnilembus persalinus]|eukprot:KRX02254.1 Ankyrin repeat-containing domain [Pseudocohnilembus persalinus]
MSTLFLKLSLEKKSIKINPYESLGITKETTVQESKKLYRKGISQNQKLIQRKQKACASQILQNIQKYQQKQNEYEMPLDILSQTTQGDLTNIIILSQNDENLLHKKDNLNQNLMYLACQAGYVHVVKYLISKQVSPEEPKKDIESRSLHVASYYGHEQVVEILLINGAEINVKNAVNNTPKDEAYNQNIEKLIDRYEWLRKNNIIIEMLYQLQKQKLISIVYHIKNENDQSGQPQETEDIQSLFVIPTFQNNAALKQKSVKVIQQPQNYIKGYVGINFNDLEKVFTSDKVDRLGKIIQQYKSLLTKSLKYKERFWNIMKAYEFESETLSKYFMNCTLTQAIYDDKVDTLLILLQDKIYNQVDQTEYKEQNLLKIQWALKQKLQISKDEQINFQSEKTKQEQISIQPLRQVKDLLKEMKRERQNNEKKNQQQKIQDAKQQQNKPKQTQKYLSDQYKIIELRKCIEV